MAELATYIGIWQRTEICGPANIGRGLRCVLNTSGQLVVAAIGVRGDYMTLVDGLIGEAVDCVSLSGGGKVAAYNGDAAAVTTPGTLAYSGANGQTTQTSTGAVLMGKWTQPVAVGTLGELELIPVQ